MKLAIESGVALRTPMLREGRIVLEEPSRLKRHLEWWKKQGAEGLVFYDAYPDFYQWPLDHFRALRSVLDDVGLPVAAFNALRKSLFIPELADRDEKRLYHCLEVATILGAEILDCSLNVPIPMQSDAHTSATRAIFRGELAPQSLYEEGARRLKPVAKAAAGVGMQLAIELHDDGLQDTADGCIKLMNLVDEPNVGLNPDLGNWARVPYEHRDTWRDQLQKMASRTIYWEVKNYQTLYLASERRFVSWYTYLDDGMIDFREAATTLRRAGFDGWVVQEGGLGVADYIRAQLRYLEYFRWIRDEWLPVSAE